MLEYQETYGKRITSNLYVEGVKVTKETTLEQNLVLMAQMQGKPIPEAIANAPKLNEYDYFFLKVYNDLSSERSIGFGIGPIPWGSVHKYCTAYGLYLDDLEDLVYVIQKLDEWLLPKLNNKGSDNDTGKESPSNGRLEGRKKRR